MTTPAQRPLTVTDSQLAVLLRQAQWALDEAAHDFPAGRGTPWRRAELAGTLEALAVVLRASVPDGASRRTLQLEAGTVLRGRRSDCTGGRRHGPEPGR